MRGQALLLCKISDDRNRLRRPNGRHRKKSASRKNLRLADFILPTLAKSAQKRRPNDNARRHSARGATAGAERRRHSRRAPFLSPSAPITARLYPYYGIVYNTIYSICRGGARAKILQKLSRRYAEKTAKNLDFTAVFVILYDFSVFQQNTIYCIYRKKINTISCLNLLTYTGRSAIMKLDPLKQR